MKLFHIIMHIYCWLFYASLGIWAWYNIIKEIKKGKKNCAS